VADPSKNSTPRTSIPDNEFSGRRRGRDRPEAVSRTVAADAGKDLSEYNLRRIGPELVEGTIRQLLGRELRVQTPGLPRGLS